MTKGNTIEYGVRFNVDQSSLSTIRTEINRISHEIKEMAKDPETLVSKDTITNVEKLQHALNQSWNTKLNQLNLTKFQSELQKSKISMSQLKDTFLEIGKFGTFNNLTSNLLTANAQLKVTNDWMERIATSFSNVARYALSSKIFNNFVNSISKAYQYTVDLDTALNKIRIVSNQSAEQMDRFAISANKAAKELGRSTLEYAKGALIYYQQGLSAEEANKRTEVTLKMANVLGASAQEVSNYMTAIWNNFNDGTETLEHYADVITALGAATASSSEEIATGLEKFSAVAKTIGLSYEYATTALATVVAQTRQSADTVGTAFKTIFARMEDLKLGKTLDDGTTLGKYSSTLAKIGVNIKDQNGQLKDMDAILNEMGAKWATLSKDQQVAVAQGVAGIRQYTQLTALLDNWDKFTQNLTVAQGSAGTLQKQQETYMQSFEAHLQKLKTEAERTYDILFDADSAKDFIDIVTAGFTKINDVLANMGGGLNTFINLLSQVGTIFSKQIGTEVVRVWNNAKTSFMGQRKKEAFVDETIKTYQEPNKTGLEKIYGKNDLTDEAVEQQAKNIKQILKVSSGLTSEQQEQVIKEQQKIAILEVEIKNRERLLELAKEEKILTSEQADKMKEKAAQEGNAADVERFGDISKALKEKERGADTQQRQEYADLNQNREDIVREGQQNQDIAKTTRKVFATVQGVNALISAMKVLSDESATTKEKVSGVAQSAVSGIGAAVSAFNPLVGMLIQIGGSLLVPVIADMIDFRSETEKLADKAKELQADFEKVSNTYQELKGTLSNYETAQKGLEGLEQGTVEFYEALMEANTQAQTLIDKLHLVAGQDYSIDVKTGLLKINADALEDAMFREQQNVMRAQVASLNAQYDWKRSQRNDIVANASKATETQGGYSIPTEVMEKILNKTIEKQELKSVDKNGQEYGISQGIVDGIDLFRGEMLTEMSVAQESQKEITKTVADFRGQYDKISAEMLALQKQIAYNMIQAYGTKEQLETYQNATSKEKELLAKDLETDEVDQKELDRRKKLVDELHGSSAWIYHDEWSTNTYNLKRAKKLDFSDEQLQMLDDYGLNSWTNDKVKKAMAFVGQGYKYKNDIWYNQSDQAINEDELFDSISEGQAEDYIINQMAKKPKVDTAFDKFTKIQQATENYLRTDYYAQLNKDKYDQEAKNYITEATFAAKQKDNTYDYSILNKEEAKGVKNLLDVTGSQLSDEQYKQLQQAMAGLQDTTKRAQKDLVEYNDAISQNATSLGTSSAALKIYDAALQNADKSTVQYNKTLADAAAESYKFNKTYNEGRKTFNDNKDAWNTYIQALKKGKKISYDVADGAGAIVQELSKMNIQLSNEDLKNQKVLNNIKKLFNGTEKEAQKAYEALEKVSLTNMLKDNFADQFQSLKLSIDDFVNYVSGLKPGAALNQEWTDNLVKMINNSNMTLEQVQQLFANAHIEMPTPSDYTLSEETAESEATKTTHYYNGSIPVADASQPKGYRLEHIEYQWDETTTPVKQKYFKFNDQKITLKKGSSASNFGNFTPSSSGKKSSGSGSQSKKADKINDEFDRYHQINTQITKVDNSLKKVQSQQNKLTGGKLIENLNKQWQLLNTQVENYNKKLSIANEEQKELYEKLSKRGFKFNADGTIANYMSALQAAENKYNAKVDQYNKLSSSNKKKWDNNKTLDKAKEEYEETKKIADRYDELVSNFIPGLQQDIQDSLDKQIELNVQKFNLKLTVTLDMNQATRDWNEWKKRIIDGIDEDDIYGNANARLQDFSTYYSENGLGDIQAQTEQVNSILTELREMDENGWSDIYHDDRAQALEELKEKYTALMESMTDAAQIEKDLYQAILDEMDAVREKFDEQVESYEFLRDIINHDLKVVQMVYGEDAYGAMSKFYDKQQQTYNEQLDFHRQEMDLWYARMEAAEEGSKEWEKARDNWKDAVANYNQTLEAGLENAKNKFQNALNDIFQNLNNQVTNGKGLDFVNEEWELVNKNANKYLDTINATYGIRELEKKYLDSINKTDNVKAQQNLKKVMDEQLTNLRQKDKLTQYDLDRANKLYEIEIARMALEDARQNKSQMRLRRDSQGNYSYQYVANQDELQKAQDQVDQLTNSLYNFDKERYNAVLSEVYNIWNEYQQKMAEASLINDPELRAEKQRLIQEQYNQLMMQTEEDYQVSKYNLEESFFNDWTNLNDMSLEDFQNLTDKEKDIIMTELVPTWKNGVSEMAEVFSGENGFAKVTQNSWKAIKDAEKAYDKDLKKLETTAGQTYDSIKNGLDTNISKTKNLIKNNNDLIDTYDKEITKVKSVYDAVGDLIKQYNKAETAAKKAAEEAYKYQNIDAQKQIKEIGNQGKKEPKPEKQPEPTPTPQPEPTPPPVDNTPKTGTGNGIPEVGDDVTVKKSATKFSSKSGGVKMWYKVPGNKFYIKAVSGSEIKIGDPHGPNYTDSGVTGWVNKKDLEGYNTGGYTGSWDNSGRLAMLHQKELILNQTDTKNMLNAVSVMRGLTYSLGSSILAKLANASATNYSNTGEGGGILEQDVHIEATFPNVRNAVEIEQALNNLVNVASQRIMEKR